MKLKKKGVIIISCLLVVSILLSVFISEKIWDMRLRKAVEKVSKMPIQRPYIINNGDGTLIFPNCKDGSKYFVYNIADNKITSHSKGTNERLVFEQVKYAEEYYIEGDNKYLLSQTGFEIENIKTKEKTVILSLEDKNAVLYKPYCTGFDFSYLCQDGLEVYLYFRLKYSYSSDDDSYYICVYNTYTKEVTPVLIKTAGQPKTYNYNGVLYFAFADSIKIYDSQNSKFVDVLAFETLKGYLWDFCISETGILVATLPTGNDLTNFCLYSFDGKLIKEIEIEGITTPNLIISGEDIYTIVHLPKTAGSITRNRVIHKIAADLSENQIIYDDLYDDKWSSVPYAEALYLNLYDSKFYYLVATTEYGNDSFELFTIENGKAKGLYYEKPNILRKLVKRTCK